MTLVYVRALLSIEKSAGLYYIITHLCMCENEVSKCGFAYYSILDLNNLALVVQKLDSAKHWINHYRVDKH